jgi:hypothetical protein
MVQGSGAECRGQDTVAVLSGAKAAKPCTSRTTTMATTTAEATPFQAKVEAKLGAAEDLVGLSLGDHVVVNRLLDRFRASRLYALMYGYRVQAKLFDEVRQPGAIFKGRLEFFHTHTQGAGQPSLAVHVGLKLGQSQEQIGLLGRDEPLGLSLFNQRGPCLKLGRLEFFNRDTQGIGKRGLTSLFVAKSATAERATTKAAASVAKAQPWDHAFRRIRVDRLSAVWVLGEGHRRSGKDNQGHEGHANTNYFY